MSEQKWNRNKKTCKGLRKPRVFLEKTELTNTELAKWQKKHLMSKVGNERGDETMGTMNIPRTIWEHYEEVDLNKLDNKKNGIHLCNKPTNRNPEEINPLKRSIRNKIKLWEKSPTKENLILSYSTKHLRTSYYWVFWKLLQILEKGYRGVEAGLPQANTLS